MGGATFALAANETGVGSSGQWIVAADLSDPSAAKLIAHSASGEVVSKADVGALIPASIAIRGDQAFVSGINHAGTNDPGVLLVDLRTGTVSTFVETSKRTGYRYLKISPDGKTLVSAVCAATEGENTECDLEVVDAESGKPLTIAHTRGDVLRAATADTAIMGTNSSDGPPTELVAVDLGSGKERWSIKASEFHSGYLAGGSLIQSSLDRSSGTPEFVLAAIDVLSGNVTELSRGPMTNQTLWTDASTDGHAVIGLDDSIAMAVSRTRTLPDVTVVAIEGGQTVTGMLPVGLPQ